MRGALVRSLGLGSIVATAVGTESLPAYKAANVVTQDYVTPVALSAIGPAATEALQEARRFVL